ncbi:MAG TPA: type II secretion system F family protein [Phycisphaerae bacterium]|nr:type II secretion system F family protein [Phycisphaerae bacterium]
MAWFEYKGMTPGGTAITGHLEAADHDQAAHDLALMQIEVRDLCRAARPPAPARIGADDLIFLNEQIASLAQAGIALDEGLAQLARDLESQRLKRWILDLVEDLRRGTPIDRAVAARQQGLPILYSRVIRAGVQSGQLAATLLNLNQHLRLMGDTRRIFWELATYPLVVVVIALGVLSLFFTLIVPQFADIFRDFGTTLPSLTMLLINISFIYPQLLLGAAIVLALIALLWRSIRYSASGRMLREGLLLRLPLFGILTRSSLIARFLRMISMAVNTGLPMPEAIRLSAEATGSNLLTHDADRLAAEVERGESIFVANQSCNLIPPLFGFCVQVASGRDSLPIAVGQLARAYENRAFHALAVIRVALYPILIILLAFVLGICVIGMFLPLITLVNSVSGGG